MDRSTIRQDMRLRLNILREHLVGRSARKSSLSTRLMTSPSSSHQFTEFLASCESRPPSSHLRRTVGWPPSRSIIGPCLITWMNCGVEPSQQGDSGVDDQCRCHAGRGQRSTGLVAADRSLQVSDQSIFIGHFEPSCDSCRALYDLRLRRIDAKHDPERGWVLLSPSRVQQPTRLATSYKPRTATSATSPCSRGQELTEMLHSSPADCE